MKVFHLNGDIFDLDQVIATNLESDCLRLTFRNGDQIPIHWRDERERAEILQTMKIASAD